MEYQKCSTQIAIMFTKTAQILYDLTNARDVTK